jgi:hypothetical protein
MTVWEYFNATADRQVQACLIILLLLAMRAQLGEVLARYRSSGPFNA